MDGVSTGAKVGLALAGIGLAALLTLTIGGRLYCAPRHLHTHVLTPTIHYGDWVWTRPTHTVHRGEIVLLKPPPLPQDTIGVGQPELVISRVVALGGETVGQRDGHLQIDGHDAAEPYLADGMITRPSDVATTRVPVGSFYVLGDNRPDSGASNVYGPVPLANLRERVVWVRPPSLHLLDALAFLGTLIYAVVAINLLGSGRRPRR